MPAKLLGVGIAETEDELEAVTGLFGKLLVGVSDGAELEGVDVDLKVVTGELSEELDSNDELEAVSLVLSGAEYGG